MEIKFTNDFFAIANAGDTTDTFQTAENFVNAVRKMIEGMYPDATVTVRDAQVRRAICSVYGVDDSDSIEKNVLLAYSENEFSDCWA